MNSPYDGPEGQVLFHAQGIYAIASNDGCYPQNADHEAKLRAEIQAIYDQAVELGISPWPIEGLALSFLPRGRYYHPSVTDLILYRNRPNSWTPIPGWHKD